MNEINKKLNDYMVEHHAAITACIPSEYDKDYAALKSVNKQFKISLSAMLVTIFAVTIGVWVTFGNHAASVETNMLKMDSLYTELGDVHGENTNVYMELKKTQTELASVQASLETLSDKISQLDSEDAAQIKVDIEDLSKKFRNQSLVKSAVQTDGQVSLEYPKDMVNILLIGSNARLTDTIMVASINPNTQKITLISVPRDLYVNGRKINEIYYYHGIDRLKQAMQDILGLKISEYVAVDLASFPKIVDALGGVDVYVEKALTDYNYPTAAKGYQTFSLEPGQYHMDGALAEKYSRSRKSTSDFDRAKRQQQVIESLYRKVKEMKLSDDKQVAIKIFNTLNEYVHTDLDIFSALAYAKMFKDYEIERNNVLTSSNYLHSLINISGAYILLPTSGNYDQIKSYVFELVVE